MCVRTRRLLAGGWPPTDSGTRRGRTDELRRHRTHPPGLGNPLGRAGLLRPLPCDLGALQQWAFCSLRGSPGAWGDVEWQVAR